tara:strand:+ start:7391 stop:7771 length:381 start_codon:yes stop_codon:yes gene_type:complete
MKKWFFLILTFILSLQFFVAFGNTINSTNLKLTSHQTQVNKLQKNAAIIFEASTIITAVTENESSLQETNQFQISTVKNNPNNFSNYFKLIETIYSSTYNQYTSAFYNFPIKFKKANLIFPFHYFW